jgi:hypothetical protein
MSASAPPIMSFCVLSHSAIGAPFLTMRSPDILIFMRIAVALFSISFISSPKVEARSGWPANVAAPPLQPRPGPRVDHARPTRAIADRSDTDLAAALPAV